jgi:GNAT superfamily N-acetyltransferase
MKRIICAVLVVAEHGEQIVGAATASPMASQKAAFRDAVRHHGMDVDTLFYFGESVLLSAYRGQGIGHAFFDAREAAARDAGATAATFCAVIRPNDHGMRPAAPRDLAPFWTSRGYATIEGLTCHLDWKDVDQPDEAAHPMQFWLRAL